MFCRPASVHTGSETHHVKNTTAEFIHSWHLIHFFVNVKINTVYRIHKGSSIGQCPCSVCFWLPKDPFRRGFYELKKENHYPHFFNEPWEVSRLLLLPPVEVNFSLVISFVGWTGIYWNLSWLVKFWGLVLLQLRLKSLLTHARTCISSADVKLFQLYLCLQILWA